jgi:hypothetical protein
MMIQEAIYQLAERALTPPLWHASSVSNGIFRARTSGNMTTPQHHAIAGFVSESESSRSAPSEDMEDDEAALVPVTTTASNSTTNSGEHQQSDEPLAMFLTFSMSQSFDSEEENSHDCNDSFEYQGTRVPADVSCLRVDTAVKSPTPGAATSSLMQPRLINRNHGVTQEQQRQVILKALYNNRS